MYVTVKCNCYCSVIENAKTHVKPKSLLKRGLSQIMG